MGLEFRRLKRKQGAGFGALFLALLALLSPTEGRGETKPSVKTTARSSVGYDSNPLFYSHRDIARLEEGQSPDRYRLTTSDDFVVTPIWPEFIVEDWFQVGGVEGGLALGGRVELFVNNPILNRSRFDAELSLGAASFSATVRPQIYWREYRSPETGERDSASFNEQWYRLSLELGGEKISLRPRLRLRRRHFYEPFSFRDTTGLFGDARLGYRPFKRLWLRGEARYGEVFAAAAVGQPDRSFRELSGAPSLRWRVARPLWVSLNYRWSYRYFTTDAPPEEDPRRRDARTERHRLGGEVELRLSKAMRASVAGSTSLSQTGRPHDPTTTPEVDTWSRTEASVGWEIRF